MVITLLRKIKERKRQKMNAMTKQMTRREEIESIVDQKIKENELDKPGFDLIKFLKEKDGFEIVLQNMPDDTTGLIIINDNEKIQGTNTNRLIAINNSLQTDPNYIQRRRFIIAHEYAHSQLHKNDSVLFAHRDTCKRETPQEQEADFFARCLLMPRKLVEEVLEGVADERLSDNEKAKYIASIFNVTEKKAKVRIKELTSNV